MCGRAHAQFQDIIDSDWLNQCVLEARVEVARVICVTIEMNPAAVCQTSVRDSASLST